MCVHWGRLWTGQLSHSSALSLDGGRMAGSWPASVLQVSGPGFRGGCGEMLQGHVSLQVSAACAAAEEASVVTPGLCRRTGRGRGGCQSAGGPSRGPAHRASHGPHPPCSACAMIWGRVLHEERLVLQLDCDKRLKRNPRVDRFRSAPVRTQTSGGWVRTGPGSGNLTSESLI